jgi:predicted nucleic acid-binding protein
MAGVNVLADTGALLAYLDRRDAWHDRCRLAFKNLRLPLATSSAVLTELFHLVGDHPGELRQAIAFVRSGALTLLTIGDADLPEMLGLMDKYRDRPMDYADATLVHLAHREAISTVFTVDRADFETYRVGGRRKLRVVP